MKYAILLIGVVLLFTACENQHSATRYYPVDSLVEAQVFYLYESNAKLTKTATIGANHEQTTTAKDTTGWRHELAVFAQLDDINRPSNAAMYNVETASPDVTSNLLVYALEAKDDPDHPIPVMLFKVYYLGSRENIRKIEGLYREENSLLTSSRRLSMNFENINNKIVLTSYSVAGSQKMLMGDSVQYSVTGMITLP